MFNVNIFVSLTGHDILEKSAFERRSNMSEKQSASIYFLLLLVPLFWGGAFVAAEHIITEIPPITAAAFRFLSAGILLLIIVLIQGYIDVHALKKQWLTIVLMALTGIVGYNIFFFIGLHITSAINGSLIIATTPAFITLGAVLFLGETWNRHIGIGLILSFIGVVIVISEGQLSTLLQLNVNQGDLLFIGGLICWVSHGLLGKIAMRDVTPVVTTTLTTLIGAICLSVISFVEIDGWKNISSMSIQAWLEMAFMIICSSVLGFLIWNYGIKQIGASKSSIYMNLVPINTALLAVFIYGSPITMAQIFGMIIVILGVYFVTFHQYIRSNRAQKNYKGGAFHGTRH